MLLLVVWCVVVYGLSVVVFVDWCLLIGLRLLWCVVRCL